MNGAGSAGSFVQPIFWPMVSVQVTTVRSPQRAARASAPDVTEQEVLLALERIEPLWDELFPAEQARIVRLLVDRVEIGEDRAEVRLRMDGLAGLVREMQARPVAERHAA